MSYKDYTGPSAEQILQDMQDMPAIERARDPYRLIKANCAALHRERSPRRYPRGSQLDNGRLLRARPRGAVGRRPCRYRTECAADVHSEREGKERG